MTTDALVTVQLPAQAAAYIPALPRLAVSGEHVAAAVTAVAYVLLLPAASLLMSVLTA